MWRTYTCQTGTVKFGLRRGNQKVLGETEVRITNNSAPPLALCGCTRCATMQPGMERETHVYGRGAGQSTVRRPVPPAVWGIRTP
jgi:hypothetical protein